MLGLVTNAVGMAIGLVTGAGAAEVTGGGSNPTVTLLLALIGGGIGVSIVNAIIRRRTGEDRADAANALTTGAQHLAQGTELMLAPLKREILELTRKNAELEGKLAQARRETADRAIEQADMQREIIRIQGEKDQQHNLDRAEVHEAVAKASEAQLDLANSKVEIQRLRDEVETLSVRAGARGDRRSD